MTTEPQQHVVDALAGLGTGECSMVDVLDAVVKLGTWVYARPAAYSMDEQSNAIMDVWDHGPVHRAFSDAVASGVLTKEQADELRAVGTRTSWRGGFVWTFYAEVDPADVGAVLGLFRVDALGNVEAYPPGLGWVPLDKLPGHTVKLTSAQVKAVRAQIPGPIQATEDDAISEMAKAFLRAIGTDMPRCITFGKVYCQWLDVGSGLQIEVTSNTYLPPEDRLALEDQLKVATAGMVPAPLVGPNWGYFLRPGSDVNQAARAVVGALAVYGIVPAQIVAMLDKI